MSSEFSPRALDVQAFAEGGGQLAASTRLGDYERLMAETGGQGADLPLAWSAQGEVRNPRHLRPSVWLHLRAQAVLPLTCQRCLSPVDMLVPVDRSFRFVADEATAAAEDDECEEDLLVTSRSFDLQALVEDELLMEMPLVPLHETCPDSLPAQAIDPDFEAESVRPNPFAVLGKLKGGMP